MNQNTYCYLAFSHCLGIGPLRFKNLMEQFHDVKTCYELSEADISACFTPSVASQFMKFRARFDQVTITKRLQEKGIQIVTPEDDHFPKQLLNLSDPPICLYVKGEIGKYNFDQEPLLAVVGTRKASSYGFYVTQYFASALAAAGCVIVSGLANGIDSEAHKATLAIGGRTIAFLGCGVDIVYPAQNKKLYEDILSHNGLIISEFPPGHTVRKGLFIARNRLISGISHGVLMIEGLSDSGALTTARYAANQGKDVFVPPIPLNSQLSQGPNILLKNGATLVTSPDDILQELNLQPVSLTHLRDYEGLTEEEKIIVDILKRGSSNIDDMISQIQAPVHESMKVVSWLELKGIIEKNSDGNYQLK